MTGAGEEEELFRIEMSNKNAISDPDLTPRTLERRYYALRDEYKEKQLSWKKQDE